jgi:glycerophosphoryl diester phosphodiesterase
MVESFRQAMRDAAAAQQSLILGHRGASRYAPMNTLPSFVLAAELGADGIELDVRQSADGHIVILHDETVDHTTNGSGVIREMSFAALRELDAGSWKDAKYARAQIPTLDEVFEAVGQSLLINVEIKAEHDSDLRVVPQVVDCIRRHNMIDRVIMSSFNPAALREFRALMPEVMVGYLLEGDQPADGDWMQGLQIEAVNPYYEWIDDAYMQRIRAKNLAVYTWTVNDANAALKLQQLGVNAIISDVPDVLLKALRGT